MSSARQRDFSQSDSRRHLVDELRRQVGSCEPSPSEEVFSCGAAGLDRLLPGGGLRYGMLVEWLSEPAGSGAATLSVLAAREACRPGGVAVVIDRRQTFYPPAAAAWGLDLDRLLVVHPRSPRDELWAIVQALRSPAVAALWTTIDRLESRAFRRLQLAAQAGRTLGLLLRPASVRGQPSWADVRLGVGRGEGGRRRGGGENTRQLQSCLPPSPLRLPPFATRRVHVQVLRTRGGRAGSWATLEIDDATHAVREVKGGCQPSAIGQTLFADSRRPTADSRQLNHDTHPLPVVPELADPAAPSHSARA